MSVYKTMYPIRTCIKPEKAAIDVDGPVSTQKIGPLNRVIGLLMQRSARLSLRCNKITAMKPFFISRISPPQVHHLPISSYARTPDCCKILFLDTVDKEGGDSS